MNVLWTRDSVCAGDDANAPHTRALSVDNDCSVQQVLEAIQRDGLPVIAGGNASWVACSRMPLGVLAQQWPAPKIVWTMSRGTIVSRRKEFAWTDEYLQVHLSYVGHIDPDVIMSVVERIRLNP